MRKILSIAKIRLFFQNPVVWVFAGAIGLRVLGAGMRCVIGPDAAQYLYQASAVFNGQWASLTGCKISFVSPLPIVVAAAFFIFKDWIIAGQAVNILFGWASLIPLFLILRRLFDRTVATLTTLIYALIPIFADNSTNIMRDAMGWFFITMGMFFFLRQWDKDLNGLRLRLFLVLSSLFFIIAAWTRIEAVVFLAASPLFLLAAGTERKLARCACFVFPLVVAAVAVGLALLFREDVASLLKLGQVGKEITQFISKFNIIDAGLSDMAHQHRGILGEFFRRAREILVLMPLVSIVYHMLEGVSYPFTLVLFLGLVGLRKRVRADFRIGYLIWLAFAGMIVLYVHILQTWVMHPRFLAVMIFPGCALMANGVETLLYYFQQRFHWQRRHSVLLLSALVLIPGLLRDVKFIEQDKEGYRQAALILAQQEITHRWDRIAATKPSRGLEWLLIYAHRKSPELTCSLSHIVGVPQDYHQFVKMIDQRDVDFFFYEERYWPRNQFSLMDSPYLDDFKLLGQWRHSGNGKMFALLQRIGKEEDRHP